MAQPIPFLQPDEKGQFHVDKRAANILNKINTPVSVVCVAGPYRTGKSYLLNRLIFNENQPQPKNDSGFSVGNTINACTKGIWLWSEPYFNEATNTTYLFLDTEGLNSTGEEVTFDTQIFSLSVLLSSIFVLNTQNSITESELEQLELVAECSKKISFQRQDQSRNDDDNDDQNIDLQLALHFPRLIWVLRDFALDLVDKDGNPITPNQYLERTLQPIPTSNKKSAEEKNRIRKCIRDCFMKRDCLPLPRPVNDEKLLRTLQKLPVDQLRPEFQEGIKHLKMRLLQLYGHFQNPLPQKKHDQAHDTIKYIDGKPVTGDVLLGLAHIYCQAINSGEVPTILSAWQSVLQNKKLSQIQDLISEMDTFLTRLIDPIPQTTTTTTTTTTKNQQSREPEFDTRKIIQKYQHKLEQMTKALNSVFPGDMDSVQSVMQQVGEKTKPILEKVCNMADMKAKEYNTKLFEAIMAQIDPNYKQSYNDVLVMLSTFDHTRGERPVNNTQAIIGVISTVLTIFKQRAKGNDTSEVEQTISNELIRRVVQYQSTSIVNTGNYAFDITAKAKEIKAKLESARQEIEHSKQQLQHFNEQVMEYQLQLSTVRTEKSELQNELKSAHHSLKLTTEQLDINKNEKIRLQTEFESLTRRSTGISDSYQTLQLDMAKIKAEKSALETKCDDIVSRSTKYQHDVKSMRSENENLKTTIESKDEELKKLHMKVEAYHDKVVKKDNKIVELESDVTTLQNEVANMKKELKMTKGDSTKMATKSDQDAQTILQLQSQMTTYQKRLTALKEQNEEIDAQKEEYRATLDELQDAYQSLKKENQILETNKSNSQNQISLLQADIAHLHQTIAQLQQQRQNLINSSPSGPTKRKTISTQPIGKKKSRQSLGMDDNDEDIDPNDDFYDDDQYQNHFDDDDDDNNNNTHNNEDNSDSDQELEAVSKKQQQRRQTIRAMDNSTTSTWNVPWTTSPVKVPDQEKLIERRKRNGSVFPDNNTTSQRQSIVDPKGSSKKQHERVISAAFKKSALESVERDLEDEYQQLKAQSVPMDAEEVRDPNSLTIPQLKSWLTSLDVTIPPKATKKSLIALLYSSDPRLE